MCGIVFKKIFHIYFFLLAKVHFETPLKVNGWQYICCDISKTGRRREEIISNFFVRLEMDNLDFLSAPPSFRNIVPQNESNMKHSLSNERAVLEIIAFISENRTRYT